jgi:hypothetical protein
LSTRKTKENVVSLKMHETSPGAIGGFIRHGQPRLGMTLNLLENAAAIRTGSELPVALGSGTRQPELQH